MASSKSHSSKALQLLKLGAQFALALIVVVFIFWSQHLSPFWVQLLWAVVGWIVIMWWIFNRVTSRGIQKGENGDDDPGKHIKND